MSEDVFGIAARTRRSSVGLAARRSWLRLALCGLALSTLACGGPAGEFTEEDAPVDDDAPLPEEVAEATQVLHVRFPSDTPPEVADAEWAAAVEQLPIDKATKRDQFVFEVTTWTGDGSSDGTDADVHGKVWFRTNKLATLRVDVTMHEDEKVFDRFHLGAREPGYFDKFRFVVTYKVKWVSVKKAEVSLKGTDGWFLETLHIIAHESDQFWPASSWSYLQSEARFWLDNSSSGDWQTYSTSTRSKWEAGVMEFK